MDQFKPNLHGKSGPEDKIRDGIINMLRAKGWFVMVMHGNIFQKGFPDLFACHSVYGIRLIEVKDPKRCGDVFTAAQKEVFPKLSANGAKVWVLTGSSQYDYSLLFDMKDGNWYQHLYMKGV